MGNRTASLLLVVVVVMAFGTAVWWLEDRFGSQVALFALVLLFLLLVILTTYQMARGQTREVMELLVQFGQKDAMTDRYRNQTIVETARGVTVDQRLALLAAQEERARRLAQQREANQRLLTGPEVDPYAQPGEPAPRFAARVIGQREEEYKEFD